MDRWPGPVEALPPESLRDQFHCQIALSIRTFLISNWNILFCSLYLLNLILLTLTKQTLVEWLRPCLAISFACLPCCNVGTLCPHEVAFRQDSVVSDKGNHNLIQIWSHSKNEFIFASVADASGALWVTTPFTKQAWEEQAWECIIKNMCSSCSIEILNVKKWNLHNGCVKHTSLAEKHTFYKKWDLEIFSRGCSPGFSDTWMTHPYFNICDDCADEQNSWIWCSRCLIILRLNCDSPCLAMLSAVGFNGSQLSELLCCELFLDSMPKSMDVNCCLNYESELCILPSWSRL